MQAIQYHLLLVDATPGRIILKTLHAAREFDWRPGVPTCGDLGVLERDVVPIAA